MKEFMEEETNKAYVSAQMEEEAEVELEWAPEERISWMQEQAELSQRELYTVLFYQDAMEREKAVSDWLEDENGRDAFSSTVNRHILWNPQTINALERWDDPTSPFPGLKPLLGDKYYASFLKTVYQRLTLEFPDFLDLRPEDDTSHLPPLDPNIMVFCKE